MQMPWNSCRVALMDATAIAAMPVTEETSAAGAAVTEETSAGAVPVTEEALPALVLADSVSTLRLPPVDGQVPRCGKCLQEVDPLRCRYVSKKGEQFKCHACNSKHSGLCRMLGTWPIDAFKRLPPEEQTTFWQQAGNTTEHLKQQVFDIMKKEYVEQRKIEESGTYLPLSVYGSQGYDTDRIAKFCKDTRIHPELGLTYKVNLLTESTATMERKVRENMLQMIADARGAKKKRAATDGNGDTLDTEKQCGDDSAASSASDLSSDDKKKKKKKKKRKSEKKSKKDIEGKALAQRLQKEIREKEREQNKLRAKVANDAARTIAKLAPVINRLQNALGDPDFGKVPKHVRGDSKQNSTIVATLDKEAKEVMVTKEPLSFSLSRLEEIHKGVVSSLKLAEELLGTLKKHRC